MKDPLANFDWTTLYPAYDRTCKRFDPQSSHLARLGSARPDSDRTLYARLIDFFHPDSRQSENDLAGVYEAMLYWKYYSQGTCTRNIGELATDPSIIRTDAGKQLKKFMGSAPRALSRDVRCVIELVRGLSDYDLPCMKSCTLPTRTTLLHFMYPDVVPILDKQVLKAVEELPKPNYNVLRRYLEFAWQLADRYEEVASDGHTESVLRLIDMALWVSRGKT